MRIWTVMAAIGIAASPAAAETVRADAASIVTALTAAGYPAEMKEDDKGGSVVLSSANAIPFILFSGSCKSGGCGIISFFMRFTTYRKITPDWINQWNATHNFTRVYLEKDGTTAIVMDVAVEAGGMTAAAFANNLAIWKSLLDSFDRAVPAY